MAKFSKAIVGSPINDGTTGRRYSWGLYRKRAAKSRWGVTTGPTMTGVHIGRRSLYVEHRAAVKRLHHFAG